MSPRRVDEEVKGQHCCCCGVQILEPSGQVGRDARARLPAHGFRARGKGAEACPSSTGPLRVLAVVVERRDRALPAIEVVAIDVDRRVAHRFRHTGRRMSDGRDARCSRFEGNAPVGLVDRRHQQDTGLCVHGSHVVDGSDDGDVRRYRLGDLLVAPASDAEEPAVRKAFGQREERGRALHRVEVHQRDGVAGGGPVLVGIDGGMRHQSVLHPGELRAHRVGVEYRERRCAEARVAGCAPDLHVEDERPVEAGGQTDRAVVRGEVGEGDVAPLVEVGPRGPTVVADHVDPVERAPALLLVDEHPHVVATTLQRTCHAVERDLGAAARPGG